MINKPFADIGPADIQALIDNQVPETRSLDYKAELVVTRDSDKLEFLKDVSAFANAEGGDILFGVTEKKGDDGKNTGLPDRITPLQGYNHDQEVLRLENMLVAGLKPRLNGVRFRELVTPSGSILVMRVERSLTGPHMVVAQDKHQFWGRHSKGKYMLDVDELRRLFLRNADLPERVRRLRDERLDAIRRGETPYILENNPKIVLQVFSLRSFESGASIDLRVVDAESTKLFPFSQGGNPRYNLDGFVLVTGDSENGQARAYTQVFRNGSLEVVDSRVMKGGRAKILPAPAIARYVLENLKNYMTVLDKAGAGSPFIVLLSLLDANGYYLPDRFGDSPGKIGRDTVLLPDVLCPEIPQSLSDSLRPMFDALWQSSGWREWFDYTEAKQKYG